jgi:hypothetical protein
MLAWSPDANPSALGDTPFAVPPERRSPARRLRGRLVAPVTVWTAGHPPGGAGLTVSSVLVAVPRAGCHVHRSLPSPSARQIGPRGRRPLQRSRDARIR